MKMTCFKYLKLTSVIVTIGLDGTSTSNVGGEALDEVVVGPGDAVELLPASVVGPLLRSAKFGTVAEDLNSF